MAGVVDSVGLGVSEFVEGDRVFGELRFRFDQRSLLVELQALLEKRALTPLIERAYSLDEVPLAYRRMLSGEAQGCLVIIP